MPSLIRPLAVLLLLLTSAILPAQTIGSSNQQTENQLVSGSQSCYRYRIQSDTMQFVERVEAFRDSCLCLEADRSLSVYFDINYGGFPITLRHGGDWRLNDGRIVFRVDNAAFSHLNRSWALRMVFREEVRPD